MEEKLEQQVTRGLSSQNAQKSYPFPTEAISLPSKGLSIQFAGTSSH
jgi:hypothetical protein